MAVSRRWSGVLWSVLWSVLGVTARADIMLSFDAGVPGTIADASGAGTGFTHRLPGTGAALSTNDANMTLRPDLGQLLLQSTRADINGWGQDIGYLEAPGVFLRALGQRDFRVTAVLRNVNVPNASDQVMIYAGTSSTSVVRAGVHDGNQYLVAQNTGGFDYVHWPGSGPYAFASGDSIRLTFGRTNGLWQLTWDNLTTSASGALPASSIDWLNTANDLYVGILAANCRSDVSFVSAVESFSVTLVPEIDPAGGGRVVALLVSVLGMLERRRWKLA